MPHKFQSCSIWELLRETLAAEVLVYNIATERGEKPQYSQLVYEIQCSMFVPAYKPTAH